MAGRKKIKHEYKFGECPFDLEENNVVVVLFHRQCLEEALDASTA